MSLLLGLDGLAVERVVLDPDGARVVHVVAAEEAAACPECGVFSTSLKQNATTGLGTCPTGRCRSGCAGISGAGAALR